MIKKLCLTLAAGMLLGQAAQALTIDFDSPKPNSVSFSGDYIITNQSVGGLYAAPNPQSGNYYATYHDPVLSTPVESTVSLGGLYNTLSFTWGSVDNYNTLELLQNGVVVKTVLGADVLPPGSGNQGPAGTITYSTTSSAAFDSIHFVTGSNAFEVDNITVPDGGTTAALLGLAMVGIVAVHRKLSVA